MNKQDNKTERWLSIDELKDHDSIKPIHRARILPGFEQFYGRSFKALLTLVLVSKKSSSFIKTCKMFGLFFMQIMIYLIILPFIFIGNLITGRRYRTMNVLGTYLPSNYF